MKRFAIVTDIDGVLIKSGYQILGAVEAIQKIKKHSIPFTCLTNGGG
jgi:ribonucleotide monophosphatase NagD (HAD superfamily)